MRPTPPARMFGAPPTETTGTGQSARSPAVRLPAPWKSAQRAQRKPPGTRCNSCARRPCATEPRKRVASNAPLNAPPSPSAGNAHTPPSNGRGSQLPAPAAAGSRRGTWTLPCVAEVTGPANQAPEGSEPRQRRPVRLCGSCATTEVASGTGQRSRPVRPPAKRRPWQLAPRLAHNAPTTRMHASTSSRMYERIICRIQE